VTEQTTAGNAPESERPDEYPAPPDPLVADAAAPPADTDAGTRDEAPSTRNRWLVPALIAGVVVALIAASTFFVLFLQQSDTDIGTFVSREEPVVQKRSTEIIDLFLNYDATNIDQTSKRLLGLATGSFKKDYQDAISQGLGGALQKAAASSRGQILSGPDVSFKSASEAVAIARVSQTTQNNANPTGASYLMVLQLTLIDTVDAGWKADRVEILSQRST
jgi:hypothetical protein